MIDHNRILQLAKSGEYKSHEVAKIVGCGFTTVFKVCRKHGISLNSTRKNNWKFDSKITPGLSYLLGIYLADGCLERDFRTQKIYTFMVRTTCIEIANKVEYCISAIGGKPRWRTPVCTPSGKASYAVCYYSTDFANWVNNVCQYKGRIPDFLFNSDISAKLAFISAIIDGDGTVRKTGYIVVRNTKLWIKEFPDFLSSANIRTTGLKIAETFPDGRHYYSVSINRQDFVSDFLVHPIKKERFLNPKKGKKRPKNTLCPECEINMKLEKSQMCKSCRSHHPETLARLKIWHNRGSSKHS